MFSNEQQYLIGLSSFPKFGPKRLKLIFDNFSSSEEAYQAPLSELIKIGLPENLAREFCQFRDQTSLEKIIDEMEKENINIISIRDKAYPHLLKEIFDPPQVLYYKGKFSTDNFNLAIVGSRKFTSYGKQCTQSLSGELCQQGLTLVSGLALGIDTFVHETCLRHAGQTIAVLGSGIDKRSLYPSSNRALAEKIVANDGLIISEFPLGTEPLRYNFPQRNRIISGLSTATLVIEAYEKSGALITAQFALDQNRELLAVPGSIFSLASAGPNNLIKQGAKIVTKASDVLEVFNLDTDKIKNFKENKKILPESPEEELILRFISREPIHINHLVRLTGLDTASINSTLTIMEMKGMLRNLGNMEYVLV